MYWAAEVACRIGDLQLQEVRVPWAVQKWYADGGDDLADAWKGL